MNQTEQPPSAGNSDACVTNSASPLEESKTRQTKSEFLLVRPAASPCPLQHGHVVGGVRGVRRGGSRQGGVTGQVRKPGTRLARKLQQPMSLTRMTPKAPATFTRLCFTQPQLKAPTTLVRPTPRAAVGYVYLHSHKMQFCWFLTKQEVWQG